MRRQWMGAARSKLVSPFAENPGTPPPALTPLAGGGSKARGIESQQQAALPSFCPLSLPHKVSLF